MKEILQTNWLFEYKRKSMETVLKCVKPNYLEPIQKKDKTHQFVCSSGKRLVGLKKDCVG